jgi:transcriptional regulator with XRE-family HTH domain
MGDSMEQPVRVMRLGALRTALRVRQSEVAARLGTAQGVIAQLERRRDFRVSTLRRYAAALGAELEISAIIGGRRGIGARSAGWRGVLGLSSDWGTDAPLGGRTRS